MSKKVSQRERVAAYESEIDRLTREIADVTAGKLDIRMRGADGAYAPMNVEAEVDSLNRRIAVMKDALDLARASSADASEGVSQNTSGSNGEGKLFYKSDNGDEWRLVEDVGHRRFVRHTPNASSGGDAELVDIEAFRLRAPHSPQNDNLEKLLTATAAQ